MENLLEYTRRTRSDNLVVGRRNRTYTDMKGRNEKDLCFGCIIDDDSDECLECMKDLKQTRLI